MDQGENLIITEKPTLRYPYMVCGIGGWLDGGESATGSVEYLVEKLGAKRFAEIPIDKFHIFQVSGQLSLRPHIRIENGILKEHSFPRNQFFYWVNRGADNDLILFLGAEPNLNWEGYAHAILDIAKDFAVARIYLLGGLLDKTPHTREPNVHCLCSSDEIREEMQKYGVQFANYEGPGSFETSLLYICQNEGIQTVNIIARATYYPEFNILIPRNPKSIRAVVRRLDSLLSLDLDTSDLDAQAEEFEGRLDSMTSHNPKFQKYIEELEKDYIEVRYEEPLDLSGDEAVRIAEELLRRNKKE